MQKNSKLIITVSVTFSSSSTLNFFLLKKSCTQANLNRVRHSTRLNDTIITRLQVFIYSTVHIFLVVSS